MASSSKLSSKIFAEHLTSLCVLIILVISALMLCTRPLGTDLANADGLWIEDYLGDWLKRGVDMTTWQSPMAANYFPEMLLYGVIRYVTGSIFLAFMGFRIIKVVLFVALFYHLLSFITNLSKTYRLWLAALTSSALVLATIKIGGTQDFWQLYVPSAHGGAFINTLLAVVLTLYWLRDPGQHRLSLLLLLGLLCTAAAVSDMIFVVWFTLPAIAAIGILTMLARVKLISFAQFAAFLLAPVLIERMTLGMTPYKVQLPHSLEVMDGLKTTVKLYTDALADGWYLRAVLCCFVCLVVVAGGAVLRAWRTRHSLSLDQMASKRETSCLFLLPYAAFVTPSTFLGMAAINRPASQYLLGGDLAPFSLLVFVAVATQVGSRILASRSFYITIIAVAFGALATSSTLSRANWAAVAKSLDPRQQIYPELVACLDAHAAEFENGAGVADYWEVRPINVFSRKGLRVDNIIAGELSPLPVQAASNREMLSDKKRTWAITNTTSAAPNIREADMVRWQGEPDVRFVCAGFPILVYKKGINVISSNNPPMDRPNFDVAVANFANASINRLAVRWPENRMTSVGEWKGEDLQSTGKGGYLQFGPYIALSPGRYRVEWQGKVVSGAPAAHVGRVDVSIDAGSTILADASVIARAAGEVQGEVLAAVEFSVAHPVAATEFRFYVNEGALVSLNKTLITRLSAQP